MPIAPDDKDWTWVTDRACEECGFDPSSFTFADVPRMLRHTVKAWVGYFEGAEPAVVTARPNESTWSPLEYAAHTRDVYRVFHSRLNLMLLMVNPTFPNWDQDETAVERKYASQDPEKVMRELVRAGSALAAAFEDVSLNDVARRGTRSNGSEFTIRSISIYALHDVLHHIHDVMGQRADAVAPSPS